MKDFFRDRRPHEGLPYDDYLAAWRAEKDAPLGQEADKETRKRHYYVRYNYERSEQMHAQYEPSAALREAARHIRQPQLWMVLTENWCGDSAYNLPVIADAAGLSEQIDLRILPRDDNLDVMDQYLTGTSRSIPKLVAFDAEGAELFAWGPRPAEAGQRFEQLKASGKEKEEVVQELLAWYEADGGQQVDAELAAQLQEAVSARTE